MYKYTNGEGVSGAIKNETAKVRIFFPNQLTFAPHKKRGDKKKERWFFCIVGYSKELFCFVFTVGTVYFILVYYILVQSTDSVYASVFHPSVLYSSVLYSSAINC